MRRSFTVLGKPTAKQRARSGNGHHYTPKQTQLAEARVLEAYLAEHRACEPFYGPVSVVVLALHAIPQSWNKARKSAACGAAKTTKPDVDNIGKLVTDALNGVAYCDDAQVWSLLVEKRWLPEGDACERIEVAVIGEDAGVCGAPRERIPFDCE